MRGKFIQKKAQWYWYGGQNGAKMGVSEAPWGFLVFAHKHEPPCEQKNKKQKGEIDVKKVISIALALLMVAVMLPVMAMAADDTELPVVQNGVIKLTNNVILSKMTEINGNITLDLNGFTISGKGTVLDLYGTIEIKDSSKGGNGKIVSTERTNTPPDSPNSNGIWINNNTSVTINSGTIEGNTWGVVVAGVNASFTMNGGTVINGITGNGNENAGVPEYAPTTITINGGVVNGGELGIYHPQVGKLTINNGEITGKSGIEMRAGELVVNGGVITATGTPLTVNPNGGGSTTVGAAVAIAQHTTKRPITVNISGGTFTGGAALLEANPQGNPEDATKNVRIVVNSGTFNGDVNKDDVDASNLLINGGTFTDKESAEKYLANGKELDGNGNVVNKPGTPIIIYNPTEDTPKANDQKNPGTGANDFVGVAAAMAVVSLLGAAAVIRKK